MSKSPHNPSLGRRNPGDEALERAVVALQMHRPGEAERLAAGVLRANRNHHMAAKVLGWALLAQNRAGEAIAPVERAARRSNDPEIETVFAVALAATGRQQEALDQLRQTTARRPAFPPAFREYAGQFVKLDRFDEAIAVIESGIALAPDAIDLQIDLARLHLSQNDRAKARKILSKALEAAPGRPDILASLARVMVLDGDYAAAADMFRHLLALRPDDAMTRADLAACQFEMGAREAGESTLRAATRGRPEMLGRAVHLLAATSHGRFFFRPSAAVKFLGS
ncbi:MAG: tetratricopeptide repeat protein [Rhizobiales bacterium]|nr:tetratricopeptide repeat protein [Hyphomicrobiales bacterium]